MITISPSIMKRKAAEFWWSLPIKGHEDRKPFIAPKEVSYYTRNSPYDKWTSVTWSEVHAKRTAEINARIASKRHFIKEVQPAIIWVFYNPGFLFSGWYITIRTLKNTYYLDWKKVDKPLIEKAMSLYPCGILPSFEFQSQWVVKFAKEYHTNSFKRAKNQGSAYCYAVFDKYGSIIDLLPPKKKVK